MTTPRVDFNFQYDNRANRWRNPVNGQFVSENTVIAEMRRHQEATYTALDNLTKDLYAGRVNIQQWQTSVALELKDAHLAQAMFGAGGRANMDASKWGRVGGTLADEYRYLTNFANQIANGDISEKQALARIKQYGNATQQSYYREYANAGDVPIDGSNPLDTVPGAGATRCRGNCKCSLSRDANGLIIWSLSVAEHCPDCIGYAAGSPYTHLV